LRYCRSRFLTFVFFMQKLTGISSGKNNKSCRIFYHESSIICFAFFSFFYNFRRNLQESAKSQILLELTFCREALGKKSSFAMWSLGALPARLRCNSGRVVAGVRRGGWGGGLGATRVRFGVLDRGGAAPASGTPAARESGRCSCCSRRGWGSVGPVDGSVSYGRGRGGWREALPGLQMARNRSSLRPGARTPAGGVGAVWFAGERDSGAFIGAGRTPLATI
jgi:hypothetical protein